MLARPNASAAPKLERKTCRTRTQPTAAASVRKQNCAGRQFTAGLLVRNTLTRRRAQQKADRIQLAGQRPVHLKWRENGAPRNSPQCPLRGDCRLETVRPIAR